MKYHLECVRAILDGEIPCQYCEQLMEEYDITTGWEEDLYGSEPVTAARLFDVQD